MLSKISLKIAHSIYNLAVKIDHWDSGKWRHKLSNRKKKTVKADLYPEVIVNIKKFPSRSDDTPKFKVFTDKTSSVQIERVRETPSVKLDSHTVDLLKQSIVISMPFTIDRPDLEFVAFSKLDHYPIYRYIGNNFKDFDLPYTEMVSIENPISNKPTPPKSQTQMGWIQDYSNHHKLNE